jgi:hypothetical protein
MSSETVHLLKDILRVLTPNEINELTTKSDGDNLAPLSEILLEEIDEIDFRQRNGEDTEYKKKVTFRAGKSASKLFRFVGLTNTKTIVIVVEEDEKRTSLRSSKSSNKGEEGQKDDEQDFLQIKEDLNGAYRKIKGQEVLTLYKNYAAIDINQLKATKDDLKKSAHSGNLINKRQA